MVKCAADLEETGKQKSRIVPAGKRPVGECQETCEVVEESSLETDPRLGAPWLVRWGDGLVEIAAVAAVEQVEDQIFVEQEFPFSRRPPAVANAS